MHRTFKLRLFRYCCCSMVVVVAAAVGLFRIKYISLCRLHGSFVHLFVKFSQNLAHFFICFVSSLTDTHIHSNNTKPQKKLKRKKLQFWNRKTSVKKRQVVTFFVASAQYSKYICCCNFVYRRNFQI